MVVPRATHFLTIGCLAAVVAARFRHQPARFLVTATERNTEVFVWPNTPVELHCRPQTIMSDCIWYIRWTRVQLTTGCNFTTVQRGEFECTHGDEHLGSVHLRDIRDRYFFFRDPFDLYEVNVDTDQDTRNFYYCFSSEIIIPAEHVCDGRQECSNGDDEGNCVTSCGRPAVLANSFLDPAGDKSTYTDGSHVTYRCRQGMSFHRTLNASNRICLNGHWSGEPPACFRNVALGENVTAEGPTLGSDPQVVVDGEQSQWYALTPSDRPQSLSVTLSRPVVVSHVVVQSIGQSYRVLVTPSSGDAEQNSVECPCQEPEPEVVGDTIKGVRYCTCSAEQSAGEVRIQTMPDVWASLLVSEIAVFTADQPADGETSPGPVCSALDQPANGRYQIMPDGLSAQLVCDPGYQADQAVPFNCSLAGPSRPLCRPIDCGDPPELSSKAQRHWKNTTWSSEAEYSCKMDYTLFPFNQRTVSVCGEDGLWSLGQISCIQRNDVRVVVGRLEEQNRAAIQEVRQELASVSRQQERLIEHLQTTVDQLTNELSRSQRERQEISRRLDQLEVASSQTPAK